MSIPHRLHSAQPFAVDETRVVDAFGALVERVSPLKPPATS